MMNIINKKRILGVDLGDKRTGLAVTDPTGILATGLELITASGVTDCARQVAAFAKEYEVGEIVIGNPINMNGTLGESTKKVGRFSEILAEIINGGEDKNVKITLFDERLSSSLAHIYMNQMGVRSKNRKSKVDMLSAQIILQNYIDSLANKERNKKKMKLGISIYSISRKIMKEEMTAEKAVEWLCETGAEVIELVPFGIDMINNKDLAGSLKKTAIDNGGKIANYSLNANFLQLSQSEYDAECERVRSHIDVAGELELATMRIDSSSYRRNPEDNTIENFMLDLPVIADAYDKLCEYAAQYDLKILLENHGFHINGSDRVGMILNSVKAANFGHQLDTGNFLCVDENPEVAVKRLIAKADVIHMKDFYVRDEDANPGDATQFDCSGAWFRSQHGAYLRGSILCQGDMRMNKIMSTIKQSAFDGEIYLEYEGMEDCFYGTKVGFDNMREYLK